ncbi:protein bric-a-brac 1 isoform X2 [Toxorhynchites rutilus septentrionalis]|uniref:protein bric-a-brac 1 isoform X2 n=1 Tax=Toxorhynchites rutilus septentrionalis TaxID=329112 RepID=UPI0024797B60|nr:protein bric-a-brac 1 isoform X2 [Toxorhynchites rutilus septentrionalis]
MPADTPPPVDSPPTGLDSSDRRPASVPSTIGGLAGAGFKRASLLDKSEHLLKPTMNQNQQFCLRWNNYQTNLTSVFDQLLQSESFVDVTLACDGQSIKAHKMVLSACSPYFQTLFFDNPCQHPIVIMRDVKWPELKAIVDFMYKGEINVSQDQIGPLLKIAEMLKIRGLADVNGDQEVNQVENAEPSGGDQDENIATNESNRNLSRDAIKSENRLAQTDLSHNNNNNNNNTPTHLSKKARTSREREPSRDISVRDFPRDLSRDMSRELNVVAAAAAAAASGEWPLSAALDTVQASTPKNNRKRRWPSGERSSVGSPADSTPDTLEVPSPIAPTPSSIAQPASTPNPLPQFPIPPALDQMAGLSSLSTMTNHPDDMEIKPGIAEMIREEERAKLLENSQAWLGASTSSIAGTTLLKEAACTPPTTYESYQYQLQSMWQKCWNSQNLIHHLRFRERGPLKSWRPETMAEAIFSVLKEGLSLSQAARKYDIPYPTFVLYANRVHNMLGPSIDGGTDLRPKGRGRPQRILLGIWPDDHIKGVIKSVVFRDVKEIKEEPIMYGRHSPFPFQDNPLNYTPNANGQMPATGAEGMSQEALTAATVAAVRQQMCNMVAAAQHHPEAAANLVGFNLPQHHANMNLHSSGNAGGSGGGIPVPKLGSPAVTNQGQGNNGGTGGIQMPRLGSPAGSNITASKDHDHHGPPSLNQGGNPSTSTGNNNNHSNNSSSNNRSETNRNSSHTSSNSNVNHHHPLAHLNSGSLSITRLGSPASAHDLRMTTPPTEESPLASPMGMMLEPAVNLAMGSQSSDLNQLGIQPYGSSKSSSRAGYSSSSSPPRPEHLFQDQDIAELVATTRGTGSTASVSSITSGAGSCTGGYKDSSRPAPSIKVEPMTECRGD